MNDHPVRTVPRQESLTVPSLSEAESAALTSSILGTSSLGVWMIDAELKTTFVNARMAGMLGCEAAAVIGLSVKEFLDDADRARFAARLARREKGISRQHQCMFTRKDGTSFPALLESSPVLDAAGEVVGALAMVMDITPLRAAEDARVRTEEALRRSEEKYRFLFDKCPMPKWVYDVETLRFLDVNEATVRAYGYSREELLAMTVEQIDPPDGAPRLLGAVGVALGADELGVRRQQRKDQTVFPADMYCHTFVMDGRKRRLVVAQDVTERTRLEEQLRQAQKMEAVGRLAGGVAHDFNNILSVILTYGEVLGNALMPGDPMREDAQEIVKAGTRAAELTRQLLMFSRQQVLDPKVIDLNGLLTGDHRMLTRLLGADVDLVCTLDPELGRVRADAGSLEQVIMNLVVNARDAMPTGGKLTIETANVVHDEAYARLHPGSRAGPHVMLAVTDTGMGMDAATMTRIFEPFFTTKDKSKGTGLGLSTVFGIVHQNGGTVWVYSEPGKGSSFKVYLPRVEAQLEARPSTTTPAVAGRGETILLVDDDDQVRLVARSILQSSGHVVIEARNAGEALLHAEGHAGKIHLLLTDVVMPKMSGPDLARRLASNRPDMKVLCMSGYTDDSIVRHGVVASKIAFLQKPLTPQSLMERVRAVLDGTEDRSATRPSQ